MIIDCRVVGSSWFLGYTKNLDNTWGFYFTFFVAADHSSSPFQLPSSAGCGEWSWGVRIFGSHRLYEPQRCQNGWRGVIRNTVLREKSRNPHRKWSRGEHWLSSTLTHFGVVVFLKPAIVRRYFYTGTYQPKAGTDTQVGGKVNRVMAHIFILLLDDFSSVKNIRSTIIPQ